MEPCDLSAIEARARIGRGDLSPVELLDSCLERIAAIDPAVNAVIACDVAGARAAAAEAERQVLAGAGLGLLHGLPVGVKDVTATAGLRTTWGSGLFRDHVPDRDDAAVVGLRAEGAIVFAKTNTPEWSAGANTRNALHGATGNPFAPAMSASGSSGGSAVALATGMMPLATGTDVGGSLRNPAAWCGVVGFRPSPGLVPSDSRALGWSSLNVTGPMARTVGDLCLMLSAMACGGTADPLSAVTAGGGPDGREAFHPVAPMDPGAARVAFTPDFGFAPTSLAVRDVFGRRAARLRHLFLVADDATPDCAGADDCFPVLRGLDFLANHLARYRADPRTFGANVAGEIEAALALTAEDVAAAEVARTHYYRRWQRFFRDYDFVVTPTLTIGPRPWAEPFPSEIDGAPTRSYFHHLALAYAVTLAGHPAVSLPAGLDADGMPFGLQVVGRRGGDRDVLRFAAALEAVLAGDPETARPRPDLAALRAAPPIAAAAGFLDPI